MRTLNTTLLAIGLLLSAAADPNSLARRYVEGETLRYTMKGVNNGRTYQAEAAGVVKKNADGRFVEEFAWSYGAPVTLTPSSGAARQVVSLDPEYTPAMPNLASLDPRLIGPVLDFMNFYVDLQLAIKQPALTTAGSHVLVPHGTPNSWADGKRTLIGEDAVDFDIALTSIDSVARVATVTVRHVPPAQLRVRLPAEWMRAPVADTPNNWVQVVRTAAGGYTASVGKEIFDVRLTVSLANGRILSATMDNPVDVLERECSDAALTQCGEPTRRQIERRIELELMQYAPSGPSCSRAGLGL